MDAARTVKPPSLMAIYVLVPMSLAHGPVLLRIAQPRKDRSAKTSLWRCDPQTGKSTVLYSDHRNTKKNGLNGLVFWSLPIWDTSSHLYMDIYVYIYIYRYIYIYICVCVCACPNGLENSSKPSFQT